MTIDPNPCSPGDMALYLVETRVETRVGHTFVKGFAYSENWLSPDGAARIASQVRHPSSPLSAIVKLWGTRVDAVADVDQ